MKFYLTVAIFALFSSEVSAITLRADPAPEAPKQAQRSDSQLEASVDKDFKSKDKADAKKDGKKENKAPETTDVWAKFPPLMDKLDSDMERVRARSVANQNMSGTQAVEAAYAGHPFPVKAGATAGSGNDNLAGDLAKEVEAKPKAPAIE